MSHRPALRPAPIRTLLVLAAAAAVTGCAATGARFTEGDRASLGVPVASLHGELVEAYRRLGLPVAEVPTVEPEIRSVDVSLDDGRLPRIASTRLVSCPARKGASEPGSTRNVSLRVHTRLERDGAGTDVVSEVEAWRTTMEGPLSCRSTGVLEHRIFEELRSTI